MRRPFATWLAALLLTAAVGALPVGERAGGMGSPRQEGHTILDQPRDIRMFVVSTARNEAESELETAFEGTVRVTASDRPVIGEPDAPITIVEFTDYECPYCKRFHATTFASLKREYIQTGKVRWVVRDLPLPMHPNARDAALAAHCAGDEGKFWEMRDLLFEKAPAADTKFFQDYGTDLGLNATAYRTCLATGPYVAQIDSDVRDARRAGISGTPSFVLALTGPDPLEGTLIVGAHPFAVFDSAIKLLLQAREGAPKD